MREVDAGRLRAVDLRAQLALDLLRLRIRDDSGFLERQIAVLVEERRHRIDRADGPPSEIIPFAVHGEMNAEIGVGMLARESDHLGEPWTRHEDARRGDPSFLERLE